MQAIEGYACFSLVRLGLDATTYCVKLAISVPATILVMSVSWDGRRRLGLRPERDRDPELIKLGWPPPIRIRSPGIAFGRGL